MNLCEQIIVNQNHYILSKQLYKQKQNVKGNFAKTIFLFTLLPKNMS